MLDKLKDILRKLNEAADAELVTESMETEITALFEAAVAEKTEAKLAEMKAQLEEEHNKLVESAKAELEEERSRLEEKVREEMGEFKQKLVENLDTYLDHVATEYVKENRVAIEEGFRGEMFEKLSKKIAEAFGEYGVDTSGASGLETELRESREKIDELHNKVNELMESLKNTERELLAERAMKAFAEETAGLDEASVEKVKTLCEDFDVANIDTFRAKVRVIVENFKSGDDQAAADAGDPVNMDKPEPFKESVDDDADADKADKKIDPIVERFARYL